MDRFHTCVLVAFTLIQWASAGKCPSNICTCNTVEIASRLEIQARCNTGGNTGYVPIFRTFRQSISSLYLSGIKLTSIGNQSFRELSSVRELYLNDNHLIRIEPKAFAVIDRTIQLLDLQHNLIRNLAFLTTHSFPRLRRLLLRDNKIEEISPGGLALLPALESLVLDENRLSGPLTFLRQPSLKALAALNLDANQLTDINPEDFLYLTNLGSLLVNRNQLKNLNFLSHDIFKQLHGLGASNNQLGDVDSSLFSDKTLLKWLDLSNNRLTNASFLSSCSLRKLEEIYLSSNLLTSLPNDSFQETKSLSVFVVDNNSLQTLPRCALARFYSQLQMFDISNNPIKCDCLLSWLQEPHVISTERHAECVNEEFVSTSTYDTKGCIQLPQCVKTHPCKGSMVLNPIYGSDVSAIVEQEYKPPVSTSCSSKPSRVVYMLLILLVVSLDL